MTLVQTEPKAIKIGIPHDDYSAMQGPCPSGFHVPSKDEWDNIYTAYTGLGLSGGTNFSTYLKLPLAGGRLHNTLNYHNRGLSGDYWTVNSAASNTAKYFFFDTSNIFIDNNTYRSYGYSIRSIKDAPVIPDNNWTTLYAGTGDAGIFHDTTNGLISISSNGTTWYTIADKNLGATTVYNYGDTLSENNCGKVYQRGNNYGFSGDANYNTSQITQSSTKVDVSTYGPGNYYSSSTWITVNPRQNSTNDGYNLRGGVTGIVQKTDTDIKKVYLGSTQVRPTIINFATQGPAPDGFHVPLYTDRQAVYNVWGALRGSYTSGGTAFGRALKLPKAGGRSPVDASSSQGSEGYYWSSSRSTADEAYQIYFSSNIALYNGFRAGGFSVRCFKNSPTVPTSTWTKMYGTSIESGGIFRSSADGLISLSSNGQSWITIMDKNLGATQVWNYGDALSAANCGGYFQWGNNYMFPYTGSVTTSSTRVNASAYGPGNYYSSSTFITYRGAWDTTDNGNLRGGVDGNVPV